MGIFKSKSRWILFYSICGIIFTASIITLCVVLWPKEEPAEEETRTEESSYQESSQKNLVLVDQTCLSNAQALGPTEEEMNDINLAVSSATKTVQMYDAELKCYEGTDTNIYFTTIEEIKSKKAELEQILSAYHNSTITQTYTYTEPRTTTATTTTPTPTYTIPDYTPDPAPTPDCSEYHSKYYSQYTQKVDQANRSYNSAVEDASMECASRGGGFSGCTGAAEQRLKAQLNSKINSYKTEYKQNMSSAGCNPSDYVDF